MDVGGYILLYNIHRGVSGLSGSMNGSTVQVPEKDSMGGKLGGWMSG